MTKHHNDTDMASFSVAIMLGLSLFVVGPIVAVLGRNVPWTAFICLAYFSSMACLPAIWLAIGNSPVAARVSLAVLPGTALGLLTFREEFVVFFALLALIVPLVSLPSFGLRSFGYRLVRFPAKSAARDVPHHATPLQFTLRQLFGLTATVAVYAFAGRLIADNFIADNNEHIVDSAAVMVLIVVLSASAAAAAWAALGLSKPVIRLFSVATITGAVALVIATAFGPLDPEWILQIGA
jgi:hypothetical protein